MNSTQVFEQELKMIVLQKTITAGSSYHSYLLIIDLIDGLMLFSQNWSFCEREINNITIKKPNHCYHIEEGARKVNILVLTHFPKKWTNVVF